MKKKGRKILIWALVGVMLCGAAYGLYAAGMDYWGPLKYLAVKKITDKYDPEERNGEIIFYGASNFTRWESMEEDIPYPVQNHGFGGSDDAALMEYASVLLYPYNPQIVVFQTGSNDYVRAEGTDAEKIEICIERKRQMFETFHEQLPDAHFVVMSGILLPGRSEYTEMTLEINRQLEQLCSEYEYMTYVNAEELTYSDGIYDENKFVSDGIHLTSEARKEWAQIYIIPVLEQIIK